MDFYNQATKNNKGQEKACNQSNKAITSELKSN